MKKILFLLTICVAYSSISIAQNRSNTGQNQKITQQQDIASRATRVKSISDLHEQLTNLFGINYDITKSDVITQLKKNIANTTANERFRKASLYAVYGNEMNKHLNLISNAKE